MPEKRLLFLKNKYQKLKARFISKMSRSDFEDLLMHSMSLKRGDTVFVHSSITKLYIDFEPEEILAILQSMVGEEGTLLFPCWHINIRAEDYLKTTNKIFNVNKTASKMGFLTELARRQKNAVRSLHPTNSVVALGENATYLVEEHQSDIYPCGVKSPFYKMMEFDAKIIGIGVNVNNLSFCHCIEDVMKDDFLIETRKKEIFSVKVINSEGKEEVVDTLVASANIAHRNPKKFFSRFIPSTVCHSFKRNGAEFFITDSKQLFGMLRELSDKGLSIYN